MRASTRMGSLWSHIVRRGIMRDGPSGVSFCDWSEADPLSLFDDDVSGFELYSAGCFPESVGEPRPDDHPGHCPDHPEFAPSFVHVPEATVPGGNLSMAGAPQPGPVRPEPLPRRSTRVQPVGPTVANGAAIPSKHKPVKQRWFYEPKLPQTATTVVVAAQPLLPLALMMGTSPASGSDELVSSGTGATGVGLIPSVSGFLIGATPRGWLHRDGETRFTLSPAH
jgi:hypothetical protein